MKKKPQKATYVINILYQKKTKKSTDKYILGVDIS